MSEDDYDYLHRINILPVQLPTYQKFAYMCYPYRNLRRYQPQQQQPQLQRGSQSSSSSIFTITSLTPTNTIPILFLYGGAKWVPLHHPLSLQLLISKEHHHHRQSRAVMIEEAGHWLHQTHLDECWIEIQPFIFSSTS